MQSKSLCATAALALLGGCALSPATAPVIATPAHFDAIPPSWTEAAPADTGARGPWWQAFGDPVLNDLENDADQASPTLAAALARRDEARSVLGETAAAQLPEIDGVASAERQRESQDRPFSLGNSTTFNDYRVGAQLSYEVDLWGRVRNSVRAARSEARATDADLASARLSLQASVADAYVRLRGLDAEREDDHDLNDEERDHQVHHGRNATTVVERYDDERRHDRRRTADGVADAGAA